MNKKGRAETKRTTTRKPNGRLPAPEQLAYSILDQAAEAILVCGLNGEIVLASQEAIRLAGMDPVHRPLREVFPLHIGRGLAPWNLPERRKQPRSGPEAPFQSFCRGERVQGIEAHFERADGRKFNLLMSAGPLLGSGEAAGGCIITLTDITDCLANAIALKENEIRFAHLADSNIIGIISGDDVTITEANQAFLEMLGYSSEAVSTGQLGLKESTPPEYHARDEQANRELLSTGSCNPYEKEFYRRDGSRVPVVMGGTLLQVAPFRWVGFVLNATERHRSDLALREAKGQLEQRVQERTAELEQINTALQNEINKQRETEQALLQSRAEFEALLESAPDAIVSVDRAGRIQLVNHQTERMFGYRREELLGQPVEILLPARYRGTHLVHREGYQKAPATRPMGIGLDLAGRRKDGVEFPVEISLSPVQTQGNFVVMSIIRDITENKRAQQALQQYAARLQEQADLIDLAHDAIIVRDLNSIILSWNHGAERTYGWTKEQALGLSSHDLLKTHFPQTAEEVRSKLLSEGRWEGELTHITQSGERVTVASRQVLQRAENGEPRAILEINRDITERKRVESELRQSEERIRTLVSQVRDYAIFGLDTEGRVTSWNIGAERVSGYGENEILAKPITVFFEPEDIAAGRPGIQLKMAAEKGTFEEEVRLIRKDGTPYLADIVITALKDARGELQGFSHVMRDVTDRREAEQQIQRLNWELESRVLELGAVNRELEAFSYSVSHDLRAPLRAIAGFSQALAEDYEPNLDEQGHGYIRRITTATQRLTQLIDDLLTLSRVTRTEMNREAVADLSEIARNIVIQQQLTQPERSVQVAITPGMTARGDPRLLHVALENLLANAWKFTSKLENAHIEFGVSGQENGRNIYFVRDNGAGFDMTYSDKLFSPFQRLHAADEFPGTGIGLATVQRIIRRHGGRVWAESALNQGATFYFTL